MEAQRDIESTGRRALAPSRTAWRLMCALGRGSARSTRASGEQVRVVLTRGSDGGCEQACDERDQLVLIGRQVRGRRRGVRADVLCRAPCELVGKQRLQLSTRRQRRSGARVPQAPREQVALAGSASDHDRRTAGAWHRFPAPGDGAGVGIHERTSCGSNASCLATRAMRSSRTALEGMSAEKPRSSPISRPRTAAAAALFSRRRGLGRARRRRRRRCARGPRRARPRRRPPPRRRHARRGRDRGPLLAPRACRARSTCLQ